MNVENITVTRASLAFVLRPPPVLTARQKTAIAQRQTRKRRVRVTAPGSVFGMLTVKERYFPGPTATAGKWWLVECQCGVVKPMRQMCLHNGRLDCGHNRGKRGRATAS